MEISLQNGQLWGFISQIGLLSLLLLISNILRRKIKSINKFLVPTSVLAGFVLLALRTTGIIKIDISVLEAITYHGIAIGFIAMSLRVKKKNLPTNGDSFIALKTGGIIVATYIVQAIVGLSISITLSLTIMPNMFRAAGILLPMAYGQGPGQANNIGASYELFGFAGGKTYGLALAAAGFLCACVIGVLYLNIIKRKEKFRNIANAEKPILVSTDMFQCEGEIPITDSVDKFSIQVSLVIAVYFATYGIMYGLITFIQAYIPSISSLVTPLIMGFNFIIAAGLAMSFAALLAYLRERKIMTHQYQNNYLLNRISGTAFEFMIIAGIGTINIDDLSTLWVPFILTVVFGAIATFFFLYWISKYVFKGYFEQGFVSMFGMLTGTISSGILLLEN